MFSRRGLFQMVAAAFVAPPAVSSAMQLWQQAEQGGMRQALRSAWGLQSNRNRALSEQIEMAEGFRTPVVRLRITKIDYANKSITLADEREFHGT